jgi:hypothetical protein
MRRSEQVIKRENNYAFSSNVVFQAESGIRVLVPRARLAYNGGRESSSLGRNC